MKKILKKAIHAAVDDDGKSGAIASVTGNILGAYLGARAIPEKYLEKLELRHIIQIIAEDLHEDCPNTNYFDNFNWIWEENMAKPVILFNNSELQKTAFMFACKGSFSADQSHKE